MLKQLLVVDVHPPKCGISQVLIHPQIWILWLSLWHLCVTLPGPELRCLMFWWWFSLDIFICAKKHVDIIGYSQISKTIVGNRAVLYYTTWFWVLWEEPWKHAGTVNPATVKQWRAEKDRRETNVSANKINGDWATILWNQQSLHSDSISRKDKRDTILINSQGESVHFWS